MHEEILSFLRSRPEGSTSRLLSEVFLRFKSPDNKMAHIAIKSILDKDKHCYYKNDLWFASSSASSDDCKLSELSWAVVYSLADPQDPSQIYHLSLWNPLPVPTMIISTWLIDPLTLSFEEQERLTSHYDTPFEKDRLTSRYEDSYEAKEKTTLYSQICHELNTRKPFFFSSNHYSTLYNTLLRNGERFENDYFLLSHFLKALDIPSGKAMELKSCATKVLSPNLCFGNPSAYSFGKLLAHIFCELITRLENSGTTSLKELDDLLSKTAAPVIAGKNFSDQDLLSLPEKPGVYGFKNIKGEYIYIGKAVNLKRRISGYFRQSEESPEKLATLASQADSFTVHICGSELESLIYEYRLIKKYSPFLNRQLEIRERKGDFQQLNDCIILLPHTEEGKGMSFWFRKEQKIKIKAFSTLSPADPSLENELSEFFFSDKLPPGNQDFPELEIALRWIRRNQDEIVIVWVNNYADSSEIVSAINCYWKDVTS